MKDGLQLANPVPQLLVFGAKGLQLISKLFLLLPDEGELLELMLVLLALVSLLLDNENEKIEQMFLKMSVKYVHLLFSGN